MIVLGISAKVGCGKTTVARNVQGHFRYPKITSFAAALKEECSDFFGFSHILCNTQEGKLTPVKVAIPVTVNEEIFLPAGTYTVRELLQWYGTGYKRKIDELYWINKLVDFVHEHRSMHDIIIVDDVRFRNEAVAISNIGGFLIRINPYPGYTYPHANHSSETELDDYAYWDMLFEPEYNVHTLQQISKSVVAYMNMFPKCLSAVRLPFTGIRSVHFGCR